MVGAVRRALVLALLLTAGAAAGQSDRGVVDARAAVLEQLEAFRAGDFDAAYRFASSEIREQFDRQQFEQMVRGGYPEIARPAGVVVDGAERAADGHVFVFLRIHGVNGQAVQAVYEMVEERGAWKVNGVVTRPDASERA